MHGHESSLDTLVFCAYVLAREFTYNKGLTEKDLCNSESLRLFITNLSSVQIFTYMYNGKIPAELSEPVCNRYDELPQKVLPNKTLLPGGIAFSEKKNLGDISRRGPSSANGNLV